MEAFGILLCVCTALIFIGGIIIAARFNSGGPNRLERLYIVFSWCTLPFAIPIALIRLLPPPGPHMPVAFTLLSLVRAMLGVLLSLVGAAWIVRAFALKRPLVALLLTTIANSLSCGVLLVPQSW